MTDRAPREERPFFRLGLDGPALLAIGAVAAAFTVGVFWRRAQQELGVFPSYDIYAAHYPNVLYALDSLGRGYGLWWNRLQDCGQPFPASTLVGLFYPPNWSFLLVGTDTGFYLILAFHMAVTGAGAFLLCRGYGLERAAALAGAFLLALSATLVDLLGWLPTNVAGCFAWLPLSFFFVERILRRPSFPGAAGLAISLSLQLLPGYPQIAYFTYQLIALRVLWEFLTARPQRAAPCLGFLAVGLVLPPLLAAVQLLPMAEFAAQSIRSSSIPVEQMRGMGKMTWTDFRQFIGERTTGHGTVFSLLPLILASFAVATRRQLRLALFYLFAVVLYLLLVFDSPILMLYSKLPTTRIFREPIRFIWMVGFCLSMLAALGAQSFLSLARGSPTRRGPAGFARLILPTIVGAALLYFLSPNGLRGWELLMVALLVALALAMPSVRWVRAAFPAVLCALVMGNLAIANGEPLFRFLRSGETTLYRNQEAYEWLKENATLQDRVHQYGVHRGGHVDYGMMPKTSSLFGIASVFDYEPQTSRRFAQVMSMTMNRRGVISINQFMFGLEKGGPRHQGLFSLIAGRYVLVGPGAAAPKGSRGDGWLRPVWQKDGVRIYENRRAYPRSFYVPRARVVGRPDEILKTLARPGFMPRREILLEEAPADGFLGSGPAATGQVSFLYDRHEEVALRVRASAPGFLFLSDQIYPGWTARVDGVATPIQRANYAFRAVRVPAGESTVEFRYRPWSVYAGAAVSATTLLGLGFGLLLHRRRRAHSS